MHRLIILLTLLPVIAAIACRRFLSDRVIKSSQQQIFQYSIKGFAEKMLHSLGHGDIQLKPQKSLWAGGHRITEDSLTLTYLSDQDSTAQNLGKTALEVGLFLLALKDPKLISRRQWAIRFGYVFPAFTILIAVFSLILAKVSIGWILAIIITSLGLASGAQLLALMANMQAVQLASIVLKKKHLFTRSHDEEAVIRASKAWAWYDIAPGIFSKLL